MSAHMPSTSHDIVHTHTQFDISQCHFLVDLDLPSSSQLEPRYIGDTHTWQLVTKYPFLDTERYADGFVELYRS